MKQCSIREDMSLLDFLWLGLLSSVSPLLQSSLPKSVIISVIIINNDNNSYNDDDDDGDDNSNNNNLLIYSRAF